MYYALVVAFLVITLVLGLFGILAVWDEVFSVGGFARGGPAILGVAILFGIFTLLAQNQYHHKDVKAMLEDDDEDD